MDKIDFFKYPRFPLASETLDLLQQMSVMMSKAAGIGGDNYILSGCVEAGPNVGAGFIVFDGEVLPFQAGAKETYIVVEETKRSVTAEGQVFADIYISRVARFGTGAGQKAWADFARISIPDIYAKIAAVIPAGLISMWSGLVPPDGWAICDGTNGTPDLRGRFVVGQAEDPQFILIGQTGGAKTVTLTLNQIPEHTHSYQAPLVDGDHPGGSNGYDRPNAKTAGTTGTAGAGHPHENLPPYYVLAYIMKL